jgi:xanthine dehydrogenase accessory factor
MTQPLHDQIPEIALAWFHAGKGVALATVVQTWGSAPRPVGSQLVISGAGDIMGSVSGGCVEGAVVAEALEILQTGVPRLLRYGVSDDDAFSVGLACGGTIEILVEPVGEAAFAVSPASLAEVITARAARQPIALITDLQTWAHTVLRDGAALDAHMRFGKSGRDADGLFVTLFMPSLRMVIVGAVHIAQPLVAMARLAGYDPTLIDPREAFGASARFPGETIEIEWPDVALPNFGVDRRTAIITLSHDPKIDDPALMFALRSSAFYVGALGSTRTHAKRVERLSAAGFSAEEIALIAAPVGLAIGAKTPAEIAVSILAQVTERLRRGDVGVAFAKSFGG